MFALSSLYTIIFCASVYWVFRKVLEYSYDKTLNNFQFFKRVIATGFIYYFLTLSWILSAYPLETFSVGRLEGLIIILLFYTLTCVAAGAAFGAFYLFRVLTTLTPHRFIHTFYFAITLAVISYLKSILLWVLYYSPNVTFGLFWFFGDPSLSLIFVPHAHHLYEFVGLFGVDVIIGVVIFLLFTFSKIKHYTFLTYGILLLLVGSILFDKNKLPIQENDRGVNFIVIPTYTQSSKNKHQLIEEIMHNNVSASRFYLTPEDVGISERMLDMLRVASSSMLYGDSIAEDEHYLNSLLITKNGEAPIKITDKKFLIPFGEYMPILFKFLGSTLVDRDIIQRIENTRNYNAGNGLKNYYIEHKLYVLGVCSDFWSREGLSYAKKSPADTAIIFESNTIFNHNPWFNINLYAWHLLFTLSTGKGLVIVSNDTSDFILR